MTADGKSFAAYCENTNGSFSCGCPRGEHYPSPAPTPSREGLPGGLKMNRMTRVGGEDGVPVRCCTTHSFQHLLFAGEEFGGLSEATHTCTLLLLFCRDQMYSPNKALLFSVFAQISSYHSQYSRGYAAGIVGSGNPLCSTETFAVTSTPNFTPTTLIARPPRIDLQA